MKRSIRPFLTVVAVLFVLAIIIYPKVKDRFSGPDETTPVSAGRGGAAPRAMQRLNVTGYVAAPTVLKEIINSSGTLLPDEEVYLSFETSGQITDIFFEEGTRVARGQLLAKINDRHLQAQLLKLEAQRRLVEEREYRQRNLFERDAISRESYDQVVTELQSIGADIQLIEARIAETELRAPFDGVVGLRYQSEGSYATPSTRIARLVKNSPLKLEFSIPERYSGAVKAGSPVNFRLDGINNTFTAEVYAIDPKVDVQTRAILVRALFPNIGEELKPGRFTNVTLQLEEISDAIAIPTEALIPEIDGERVFLYRGGRAESARVRTGLRTASTIQIVEGIAFGDTVLTTGILQLREGLPLTLDRIRDIE